MSNELSAKDYAEHRKAKGLRGHTSVAVIKAIGEGRLTKRSARKVGHRWKINADLADAEWAANTMSPDDPRRQKPREDRAQVEIDEGGETHLKGIPNRNVSRAIREAYQARLARVEYEKETGLRVLAEDVKREAFEQGRRLRDALVNIPDRLSHELAAETDPGRVHIAISQAIREALETFVK